MKIDEAKLRVIRKLPDDFLIDDANREALSIIGNAIEKQISQKVKYLNRHGDGDDLWNKDYFNCPSCGRRLRNKQKDKYCGRCGQALDWTDDKE